MALNHRPVPTGGSAGDPPLPDPVRDVPPADRFCDLVLNGGVASGVVYPWALVELARRYRFRRIGGNSVGAMAGALAAAAEYGRCHGHANAFEPLRLTPSDLAAEDAQGCTRMQRLFQPGPGLQRPFDLLLRATRWGDGGRIPAWRVLHDVLDTYRLRGPMLAVAAALLLALLAAPQWAGGDGTAALWLLGTSAGLLPALQLLITAWPRGPHASWALRSVVAWPALALLGACTLWPPLLWQGLLPALVVLGLTLLLGLALLAARLGRDLRALAAHDWGLCSGSAAPRAGRNTGTEEPAEPALLEWLHEGIQRAAGRTVDGPPLTFADLHRTRRAGVPDGDRGIELVMFSTNVTLGRPVRWPLQGSETQRLYFRPDDWAPLLPPVLMQAVLAAAEPYAPSSISDPPLPASGDGSAHARLLRELRRMPLDRLPIAVAARMSLSFPLLFSCVPVWAVDYEERPGQRRLRRCLMSDGGLCTNFPIHLFDSAHPRWPTFGLLLDRRIARYRDDPVWLPDLHRDGRADNWTRGVPGAAEDGSTPTPLRGLLGLAWGMVRAALNWKDNLTTRLPTVRNRVIRLALQPGEGQLNLGMPGRTILHMAHVYGTRAGKELAGRFIDESGQPTTPWREHLYVRALAQLRALRRHLAGYTAATQAAGHSVPLDQLLPPRTAARPLRAPPPPRSDPLGEAPDPDAADALLQAVAAVQHLEARLQQLGPRWAPYRPEPEPELRLRPPL